MLHQLRKKSRIEKTKLGKCVWESVRLSWPKISQSQISSFSLFIHFWVLHTLTSLLLGLSLPPFSSLLLFFSHERISGVAKEREKRKEPFLPSSTHFVFPEFFRRNLAGRKGGGGGVVVGWPLSFRGKKEGDVHALEKRTKNGENPCLFYFSARFFFQASGLGGRRRKRWKHFFPRKVFRCSTKDIFSCVGKNRPDVSGTTTAKGREKRGDFLRDFFGK